MNRFGADAVNPTDDRARPKDSTVIALLAIALRHTISEPTVEAGYERIITLAGTPISYDAFRDAIDACLRDGLIREPVRLPEGALQCHWRLELTPRGVAEARRLGGVPGGNC